MSPNILVVSRGELIGDGMLKLPFIRAFQGAFPNSCISWLSIGHKTIFKRDLEEIISPYICDVFEFSTKSYLNNLFDALKFLRSKPKYDIIINTEKKFYSTLFLKFLPCNHYISDSMAWLFSSKHPLRKTESILLIDRLMQLLNVASGKNIDPCDEFSVPKSWVEKASYLVVPHLGGGKIVALAPGAGGRFKCWPLSSFIELGSLLKQDGVIPIFILGPSEEEWIEPISNNLPDAIFPLQKAKDFSVYLSMALASLCDVNVANDSGVGHILASSNKPLISLWGPTDPLKSTPNGKQVIIVQAQSFGSSKMEDIPVPFVYKKVKDILKV
ncbi:MAG: glycosyltransferase family 9 protein [Alphaproteobacteria bacterium]